MVSRKSCVDHLDYSVIMIPAECGEILPVDLDHRKEKVAGQEGTSHGVI